MWYGFVFFFFFWSDRLFEGQVFSMHTSKVLKRYADRSVAQMVQMAMAMGVAVVRRVVVIMPRPSVVFAGPKPSS